MVRKLTVMTALVGILMIIAVINTSPVNGQMPSIIPINQQAQTSVGGLATIMPTQSASPAIIPLNQQAQTTIYGVATPGPTPNPSASIVPLEVQAHTTIFGQNDAMP